MYTCKSGVFTKLGEIKRELSFKTIPLTHAFTCIMHVLKILQLKLTFSVISEKG